MTAPLARGEGEHRLRHRGPRAVSVPLSLLEDGRLSGWARTLGAWISSRPDGWRFWPSHIMERLSIGKDAYQAARRQLIAAGWLMVEDVRQGGRYESPDWTFCGDNQPPTEAGAGFSGSGPAGDGSPADIYRVKRSKSARAKRPVDNSTLYQPLPKGEAGHKPVPRPMGGQTRVPPQAGG